MLRIFTFLFIILFANNASAQICKCPPNRSEIVESPLQLFRFSNKRALGICGYQEIKKLDTIYSEFGLFECGKSEYVDEWDATCSCRIKMQGNVLIVSNLYYLPTGKNFEYRNEPFYIQKFWYRGVTLHKQGYFDSTLKKYSPEQIEKVFAECNKLKKDNNHERHTECADMLLWAYVSGSAKAGKYLEQFEKKFGPFDGAIAEQWNSTIVTYEHYKETHKQR